jgi:hypothetical protein
MHGVIGDLAGYKCLFGKHHVDSRVYAVGVVAPYQISANMLADGLKPEFQTRRIATQARV